MPAAWPGEGMLALDDSQAAAVKGCLTQQLAVVQGPPGTGKTYIGLQVTKVLLLNSYSPGTAGTSETEPDPGALLHKPRTRPVPGGDLGLPRY